MDTSWLEEAIHNQAIERFDSKWSNYPEDEEARNNYQALKQTQEFKNFRFRMIELYEKTITQNIISKMQGLEGIIKEAGEE
ncbi:MAG: hypothetical protein HDR41_00665 [Lactobacillus sp.]|nr:hypothetical protein [Lactobacillus sp.]